MEVSINGRTTNVAPEKYDSLSHSAPQTVTPKLWKPYNQNIPVRPYTTPRAHLERSICNFQVHGEDAVASIRHQMATNDEVTRLQFAEMYFTPDRSHFRLQVLN